LMDDYGLTDKQADIFRQTYNDQNYLETRNTEVGKLFNNVMNNSDLSTEQVADLQGLRSQAVQQTKAEYMMRITPLMVEWGAMAYFSTGTSLKSPKGFAVGGLKSAEAAAMAKNFTGGI